MSLQFVLGNSGSGKSTYIYEYLVREATENRHRPYMIIVPEQFTMHTQRELVLRSPGHVIMNIEVLSFERLAYRIFDELSTDILTVLEDTGKNLVLYRVAEEQKEQLKTLSGSIDKPGFISEMKSLISELMQYGIGPEDFAGWSGIGGMPRTFTGKAEDILLMYRGFLDRIHGSYVTAEEILQKLIAVIRDSKLVREAVIAFDGFTGFTPVQNALLKELLPMTERILITGTIPSEEPLTEEPREEDLFYMTKRMVRTLKRIASHTKTKVEEPVRLNDPEKSRFSANPVLLHLEQNLFRPGGRAYDPSEKMAADGVIRLRRLSDPREELVFTAASIRRLIAEKNYRYRDFAVICAAPEEYENYVEEIFSRYEIPVFLDRRSGITFHPAVEFVRAALRLFTEKLSFESVMNFLRTGYAGLSPEEIDGLEHYLKITNIRGITRWRKLFTVIPARFTPEDVVRFNEYRTQLLPAFELLYQGFGKRRTVGQMTSALYEFLCAFHLEEALLQKAALYEEKQDEVAAARYRQIYGILMDLLDKLMTILGEEEMEAEAYSKMLLSGMEAAKIGVIPPSSDSVVFGDIERTRLEHIRVLFLVGANDGAIPKSTDHGGILSEGERETLKAHEVELSPTARERAFLQRFYLYLVLTKAADRLIVTYAKTNAAGEAVRRSYLISTLRKLFPGCMVEDRERLPLHEAAVNLVTVGEALPDLLRRFAGGEALTEEEEKDLFTLYPWYAAGDPSSAGALTEAAFFIHREEPLKRAAEAAVKGETVFAGASRLEQYASCAYAYFLNYRMKLSEEDEHGLNALDMGNFYHEALERYSRSMKEKGLLWKTVSEEERRELLNEAVEEVCRSMPKAELLTEGRQRYLMHRMKQTLSSTVEILTAQVKAGRFEPKAFEVDFREISELSALQFALSDGSMLHLTGKIDRMDTCEEGDRVYVKIIDYKSGSPKFDYTKFYYGLQLQLLLYMDAAAESSRNTEEKEVTPAAMLYYSVQDPIVERPAEELRGENDGSLLGITPERMTALRGTGLIRREEEILNALEENPAPGQSPVLPLSRTGKGVRDNECLITGEEYEALIAHLKKTVTDTGNAIHEGRIDVKPYRYETEKGCDYCPYHGVCGFDPTLPGYAFRRMRKKRKDEVLAAIRAETEEQNGGDVPKGQVQDRELTETEGAVN